jgi:hypothetical protein
VHAPTCVASSSGQAPDSRVVMESPRCLLHEFWKLGWFHFCFFLNCFFLFYHSILYYWVSTIIRYMQELNNQIHILANVTLLSNLTLTNITLNPTDNSSWNFTKGFQRYCLLWVIILYQSMLGKALRYKSKDVVWILQFIVFWLVDFFIGKNSFTNNIRIFISLFFGVSLFSDP